MGSLQASKPPWARAPRYSDTRDHLSLFIMDVIMSVMHGYRTVVDSRIGQDEALRVLMN
jgi:hypothetical protein